MAYGLQTYDSPTRREDLADVIQDVSPDDNPLSTMLGTTTASQTLHEWPEDYLARPSSVATAAEGAAATYADLTDPVRRDNITQIIDTTIRVSDTQKAVDVAGQTDPYEYHRAKSLRDWKNKLEYSLINASRASGDSGVARQMAGMKNIITSHYTNLNSGTSLSEEHLNSMVLAVAEDVGADSTTDMVLTTLRLRQKMSTFTAGNTRYIDASERRLVRKVMVYEADFGPLRIFGHKDVPSAATSPGPMVFALNESKWRISYLRKPKHSKLAKDGDRENGQIVGEATLEFLAERANALSSGFAQAG